MASLGDIFGQNTQHVTYRKSLILISPIKESGSVAQCLVNQGSGVRSSLGPRFSIFLLNVSIKLYMPIWKEIRKVLELGESIRIS